MTPTKAAEDVLSSIEELDYIASHANTTLVVAQAALRAKDAITTLLERERILAEAVQRVLNARVGLVPGYRSGPLDDALDSLAALTQPNPDREV